MVTLLESLEDLVAQTTLWSGAPDLAGASALAQSLRALRQRTVGRPGLSTLLEVLARWFEAGAVAVAAPERAVEVVLASLQWATGQDPEELGLTPAVVQALADLRVPAALVARLLDTLRRETSSHAPPRSVASAQPPVEPAEIAAPPSLVEAASATVYATSEAAPSAAAQSTGPIWLAPQERDMLVEAIYAEVLPQLGLWAQAPLPRGADDRLSFLLEVQCNALRVLGLPHLSALVEGASAVLAGVADNDEPSNTLALWFVALTECLNAPDDGDSRSALLDACQALAAVLDAPALVSALPTELERLCIGLDPAHLARARREVGANDLELRPAADVIPAVLQGMLRELPAHAEGLGRAIATLRASGDRTALDDARRIAHTLKGDANTVGVRGLANLTHALEDILGELERRPDIWPHGVLGLLEEAGDTVAAMADHLLGRGAAPADAVELLSRVYATADALERDEELPEFADAAPASVSAVPDANQEQSAAPTAEVPTDGEPEETIALPRSVLDRLLRLSAESMALANQLRTAMGRLESGRGELLSELAQLREASQQLDEQVGYRGAALADRKRSAGDVDPLELDQYNELYVVSRRVQETWADTRSRFADLEHADAVLEALVQRKLRVDEDLQTVVRRSRLVPIRESRARFDRAVRQAARMLGKTVALQIEGDELAIDKLLLDALIEPLMHLLRNAVDHGIEGSETRQAAGKPAHGQLRLQFRERAQTLEIELSDDGAGLDLKQIAERGLRLGLITGGNHDAELLKSLLFRSGFTTRDEVTQISGRGVGLDVVARRITAQGGSVRVDSEPGQGSRFSMRLPLALGTLQVGLVQAHTHWYALAADSFVGFHALSAEDLRAGEHGREALLDEQWVPAIDLGTLLEQRPLLIPGRSAIAAVIDATEGGPRVVLVPAVEALALVVLEPLTDYLPPIRGVRGASVLGDGRVAPVLDLRELVHARQGVTLPEVELAAEEQPPLVIVADDSLTIRRALGDLLIDAGYAVATARDGLEALLLCEKQQPVALLVDLEMPRMNGLELTAHLRKNPRFAQMPIVMITSRTAEKHQQMALEAGVSAVLGKPYSDEDVLGLLERSTERGPGNPIPSVVI